MEAMEVLLNRRSIRKYKPEQIKEEELDAVLKAGTFGPTGMGSQAVKLVAVTNPDMVKKLSKLNAAVMGRDGDPFYGAPCVVIVFADQEKMTYIENGSCVLTNLLNGAYANGLGSCWIHRAKEMFEFEEGKALKKEWGIPENYVGVGNCILGYADDQPTAKPRKEDYIIKVK